MGTGGLLPEDGETCRIVRMSVDRQQRRQGVGSAILVRLINQARILVGFRKRKLQYNQTMKLNHDLHIHTYLSACCSAKDRHKPAAILSLAEEMGVETIGFSDHIWMNPHVQPSDWYRPQDESHIDRLRQDLQGLNSNVRMLVGCEADMIAPGKFSITPEFAEKLDHVLLACSHFHMTDFVEQPVSKTPQELARHMLKFFNSAVQSGLATAIPHPLFPIGYLEMYDAAIELDPGCGIL